ncbi:MAG: hypothetical protein RR291_05195, partial [Clostridia bacterium]
KDSGSVFKIEEFLKTINEYKNIYSRLYSYGYLVLNADCENMKAINILDYFMLIVKSQLRLMKVVTLKNIFRAY